MPTQAGKPSNRLLLSRRFPPCDQHLETFARLHGLDLELLSGARTHRTSPQRPIRDAYGIHRGGAAPTRQSGEPGLPLSAVAVPKRLQFGNSVAQIGQAIAICDSLGIRHLHLPGYWYLSRGRSHCRSGLMVRNRKRLNLRREELVLSGGFFHRLSLAPVYAGKPNLLRIMHRHRDLLALPKALPALAEDDLVVHLRSGDLFNNPHPHPGYGQPPLAYYLAILHSRPWRSVTLVFEDEGNPVIAALRAAVLHLDVPLRCASGSLSDDLAVLLSARTLVSGTGTFTSAVSALSRHLGTVYSFERRFDPWGSPGLRTVALLDSRGSYVRRLMRRNWANTAGQRQLMLRYPQAAIVFAAAAPRQGA
ncbi:MAG: hypothetical protein AAFX65_06270 [Cyanobacteria bacterium J06638_7]